MEGFVFLNYALPINRCKKYVEILTQFIDKENPPEYILCFEIRNRKAIMKIMDTFSNTKFYIVDEDYFIRPLLKWPGKNYSEKILGYEMVRTEENTNKEEVLNSLEAILEKAGERDLTVIMNPPYGKSNAIVKSVIEKIIEYKQVNETVCLAPANAFKKAINHISKFDKVKNVFDNATIANLSIAKLLPKEVNKFSFENVMLEKDELELFQAIQKYNENRKNNCFRTGPGNDLSKRYNLPLKSCWKLSENLKSLENKTFEELDKEKYIFYTTMWAPYDGVHKDTNSWDYKLNILNEDFSVQWKSTVSFGFHVFKDKESRNNFITWWYSCNKKSHEIKKQRIGLTNKILNIITKIFSNSAGAPAYNTCFPNLDWSRSWTDEEIIQELKDNAGLPQNWELKN